MEFRAEAEGRFIGPQPAQKKASSEAQLSDDPEPAELEGVAAKWKSADPLCATNYSAHCSRRSTSKDRRIIGYIPRADRGKRVALLIGTALDYRDEGPGAARLST